MSPQSNQTRTFIFWGIVCVIANLFCTLSAPYDGDQSYWVGWVQSLMDGGFENFRGNYPPLYVFWLWVVAQIHEVFGIVVDKTFLLKFLCLWPIYFAHLVLLDLSNRLLRRVYISDFQKNLVLAFVALNPGILLGGPMWGQVDLLPVVLAILALYCIYFRRYAFLGASFYILALLAKFQMILFLPVFGGIFIKRWRHSLKGIPLAIIVALVVLLPYALGDNLFGMISRAYIDTTTQYPYATYNAANLWMLTVGNISPDSTPFFGLDKDGFFFWLCPSYIGKILFVLFSVFSLVASFRSRSLRRVFELATWNGVAFFVLLPGMHERYILYAIPVAMLWLVLDSRKSLPWVVLLTVVASCNVSILCNGFHGDGAWFWLSVLSVVTFFFGALCLFFPSVFSKVRSLIGLIKWPRWFPYVLLLVCLLFDGFYHVMKLRPEDIQLEEGKSFFLNDLPVESYTQSYSTPKHNQSVEGKNLCVGGRQYKQGIGTHAPSEISYKLPENADSLFVFVGIDDEVYDNGEVIFKILGDGKLLWQSPVVRGKDSKLPAASISIYGYKLLTLKTEANGSDSYDHADWVLPIVKIKDTK